MQDVILDAFESRVARDEAAAAVMKRLVGRAKDWPRRAGVWVIRARIAAAAMVLLASGLAVGFAVGRTGSVSPVQTVALTVVPIRVAGLDGMVLVRHEGSDVWKGLNRDSTVYLGDTFHSASGSDLTLALEDNKSTLELWENSMLALRAYDKETRLFLEHGQCKADLKSPHSPFFVSTPHGRVEALGTEFTVKVE